MRKKKKNGIMEMGGRGHWIVNYTGTQSIYVICQNRNGAGWCDRKETITTL